MSEVILRLPKRRNRVKIISNPDNLEGLFSKKEQILTNEIVLDEDLVANDAKLEFQETKTQFIHKFILNESKKPIQINLSKLPKPSISIEDARIEVQSAYDNGFKDGQEATIAIYESEINHFKDRVLSIESAIERLKKSYLKELKQFDEKLIDTAIGISEYVINKEVDSDKNIIINTIKRSLEELQDEKVFQIQINPLDYQMLSRLKSKLFTNQSLANSVEIISDSQIEEGGAILISSAGTIDARISSQLRKIKEILEDALLVKEEQDFRTLQDEIDNGDED